MRYENMERGGAHLPPKVRFTREDVLGAAFQIARGLGIGSVNARAIAQVLGSSTQPLFRAFQSMEEIRREVLRMAWEEYRRAIAGSAALSDKPYKGTGLAYIKFAREEPELFKLLFMRDRVSDKTAEVERDDTLSYVIDALVRTTGFSRGKAERFHRHLWIFVHGLASMVATKFVQIDEGEVDRLLSEEFLAVTRFYAAEGDF